jgi:hypothetical protein
MTKWEVPGGTPSWCGSGCRHTWLVREGLVDCARIASDDDVLSHEIWVPDDRNDLPRWSVLGGSTDWNTTGQAVRVVASGLTLPGEQHFGKWGLKRWEWAVTLVFALAEHTRLDTEGYQREWGQKG